MQADKAGNDLTKVNNKMLDKSQVSVRLLPSDPVFVQNPYAVYEAWYHDHPTFWWQEYGHWCFAGYDDVQALFRDRRFGREILHVASREELGLAETPEHLELFYAFEAHSLLEREPPVHTRLRRLVNRAFVSRQVEQLRPRIEALAHQLIDGFTDKGQVDLLAEFATPIPVTIIAELLGVPVEMGDQLLDWSHKMVAMYQHNRDRAIEDAAVKATEEFAAFIETYVEKRRLEPRDDLISTLIAAEEDGEHLSMDELVTTCMLLLNAGHEATVHALGNGVKSLLEYTESTGVSAPGLLKDQKSIAAVVEEFLRYDSPLHMFTRYALEDCEFGGVRLKKGDVVGLLLGAANRDPVKFEQADRFWPERTDGGLTTFGGGIHFCIGAPLARLELQVAMQVLFERLPSLQLAEAPKYSDRYHFHGLERLLVKW